MVSVDTSLETKRRDLTNFKDALNVGLANRVQESELIL